MKIGMVGCGKLGLMVALTIESRGHQVKGFDVNAGVTQRINARMTLFQEEHGQDLLARTKLEMVPLQQLVDWADILFLAPQTPHAPEFEGITPLTEQRADFDYRFLRRCVTMVNACLFEPKTCVIISTVLPGTIEREIQPLLGQHFKLVYQPLFIAMGTVYNDFLNPEFVLVGTEHDDSAAMLREFYRTIFYPVYEPVFEDEVKDKVFRTDIRTAEGIKVFYNTFITAKTVLGNMYGEMAERLGMNADDIFTAISMSTDRLLSPKYLKAGMGDGGGCHPRDNIALSWLAQQCGLSFDIFTALMTAREKHCEWFAELCERHAKHHKLPVVILGKAFKPGTNIETGSPSWLLYNLLVHRGKRIELHLSDYPEMFEKSVFFIGCKYAAYADYKFPEGSIVIDPFRYIPDGENYQVMRIGRVQAVAVQQLTGSAA